MIVEGELLRLSFGKMTVQGLLKVRGLKSKNQAMGW
jgi:hypothetical protein